MITSDSQQSQRTYNMSKAAPPADHDKMSTPEGSCLIVVHIEILMLLAAKVSYNEQAHALKASAKLLSS